jgi:hypothetical protein
MEKKQIVASFAYGNPFPLLIDCLLVLVYGQLGLSCSVSFLSGPRTKICSASIQEAIV